MSGGIRKSVDRLAPLGFPSYLSPWTEDLVAGVLCQLPTSPDVEVSLTLARWR